MRDKQLIILGSSASALGVARDADRAGFACTIIDVRRGPAFYSRATRTARIAACEDHARELVSRCGHLAGTYLIADSDHWLRFILREYESLVAQGIEVLHPPAAVLDRCLSKEKFHAWCDMERFPSPRTYGADNLDQAAFPVLIRPDQTRHIQSDVPKAAVANNRRELDGLLNLYSDKKLRPLVAESLIDADSRQFSVALCRRADGDLIAFTAEKLRPTAEKCAGGSLVAMSVDAGVQKLAEAVANRIGFVGIGELEIISFRGSLYLIELNARPWLQYGLPVAAGLSFMAFLVNHEPQILDRTRAHSWLAFRGDLYWSLSRSDGLVWRNKLTPIEYVSSVLRADSHPLWSWRDPMPLARTWIARMVDRK